MTKRAHLTLQEVLLHCDSDEDYYNLSMYYVHAYTQVRSCTSLNLPFRYAAHSFIHSYNLSILASTYVHT